MTTAPAGNRQQAIFYPKKLKQIPDRKIRLFLAIDVPIAAKKSISQRLMNGMGAKAIKKVPQQNFHITLAFLGMTEESRLPTLIREIEESLVGQEQLSLILGENGCFPHSQAPKVLWVGISGDVERLCALASRFDKLLIHHLPEKFRPHITIATIKEKTSRRERQVIAERFLAKRLKKPIWFTVSEVVLYQSKLTASHAVYTKLATFGLG